MSGFSNIEWTDATWNPVRGCSRVSAGCQNCYAERQAIRHAGPGGAYEGLVAKTNGHPVWTGKIRVVPGVLDQPLRWKKPRRIFVNSMSDLFHPDVPDEFLLRVFDVMRQCQNGWSPIGGEHGSLVAEHTFQILTKRPERMRDFCARLRFAQNDERGLYLAQTLPHNGFNPMGALKNVWLGVSCEDQATADERIPLLVQTPAAVRFVSLEPLLGPVSFRWAKWHPYYSEGWRQGGESQGEYGGMRGLHWVIVGGESGPGARPCDVAWIRQIVEQCREACTPAFVKQLGSHPRGWCAWNTQEHIGYAAAVDLRLSGESAECVNYEAHEQGAPCPERCIMLDDRKGSDPAEWPEDLRVRQYPA